jgi:PTH1 family peptidyl-tRNA hydrolase
MGFLLLDYLTDRYSLSWTKPAGAYQLSKFVLDDNHLVFLKPLTYMNLSGRAVEGFSLQDRFDPWDLLVLCDDFALPLGRIRLRMQGSDGGHNGLRSITEALDSQEFPRLRMGVGPVPENVLPADFVLRPFGREERSIAENVIRRAADCFEVLIRRGFDEAMGKFNAPFSSDETN